MYTIQGGSGSSDEQSITAGFLGVLFPLSGSDTPCSVQTVESRIMIQKAGFALAKEKIICLSKHDTD